MVEFFTGYHQIEAAKFIPSVFINVNRLVKRKSDFKVGRWVMDSGAFSALLRHGDHQLSTDEYAAQIRRWSRCGTLLAAVTQDYMCEAAMLERTGLTIPDHQRMTIERYDKLLHAATGVYIMPVLQGYAPEDYVEHVRQYGSRLVHGQWIGVGSVCKRNGDPQKIIDVLSAIKAERPDLRLHGFGLKTTALQNQTIRDLLSSADSMAWSFHNRMHGLDANHYSGALKFKGKIDSLILQDYGSWKQ